MNGVRRELLALPTLLIVVATAFLGGWLASDYSEPDAIVVIPEVRVYKNGELVYHKVGDPPTDNLAMFWFFVLSPFYDVNGNTVVFSATDFLGNGDSYVAANGADIYDPRLIVIVGTGTTTPSYQDYTMQAVAWADAELVSLAWDSTNTAWTMTIVGAVTLGSAATISEVGLASELAGTAIDPLADNATALYLLFRDVLSSPISAAAGDVIEVQYSITIDFP